MHTNLVHTLKYWIVILNLVLKGCILTCNSNGNAISKEFLRAFAHQMYTNCTHSLKFGNLILQ